MVRNTFTVEKVKEVVWSYDGYKSADPGDFSLEFFKQSWDAIKEDVFRFVSDFHSIDKLTKACTTSFLTHIPKLKNLQSLSKFRPISLVGSLYKILAKLLSKRLRRVVGNLISLNQSTFVLERNILDGVLMANEIMDMAFREKRSCMLLKVDF